MLSSWSRRRAAVAAEEKAQEQAAEQAELAEQQAALAEQTDAEILEKLGLPDPDSLVQGDNFQAFMSKAVPAHLRKRALRTLWRSNPVLACVDGLNDYDGDFLTGSTGQGAISTTYQVGKGMLAHLIEMDRQKDAAQQTEAAMPAADPAPADAPDDIIAQTDQTDTGDAPADIDAQAEPADHDTAMPIPRRMTFQFAKGTA